MPANGGDLAHTTPFRTDTPAASTSGRWSANAPARSATPGTRRSTPRPSTAPTAASPSPSPPRSRASSRAATSVRQGDQGAHGAGPAGDILILVRRRKVLFEEIMRALKRRGVPVAGADRLSLSAHIAFDDLLALGRFALFPDDDLTLAALLKSPFCGLTDEDLYALAKDRKPLTLWVLQSNRADEDPRWTAARDLLAWAWSNRRKRQPFEFFARCWARSTRRPLNRAKVLTRLGGEADDALDEFLAQVMDAEQRNIRDLEALVADFAALDIIVKREMEGARREVRVMTAHGSKGLEAPIVFLPETTVKRGAGGSPLLETAGRRRPVVDSASLPTAPPRPPPASCATRRRPKRPAALYVALTRARDRLVLCGRIDARDQGRECRRLVRGGQGGLRPCRHRPRRPRDRRSRRADPALRTRSQDLAARGRGAVGLDHPCPPGPSVRPSPNPPTARYAAPSRIEDEADSRAPAPSPLAKVEGLGRYRRGEIIHRLLQILPDIAPAERRAAAVRLLAAERDLSDDQRSRWPPRPSACWKTSASPPCSAPVRAPRWRWRGPAPCCRKAWRSRGRVDRLVVTPERVLVVDYKTNRPAPATHRGRRPGLSGPDGRLCGGAARGLPRPPVEAAWCGRTVPN
jgi:ATP-dependent helicase/nuclease subunit A